MKCLMICLMMVLNDWYIYNIQLQDKEPNEVVPAEPVPASLLDPRLNKRDPRIKNLDSNSSRSNSPLPLPPKQQQVAPTQSAESNNNKAPINKTQPEIKSKQDKAKIKVVADKSPPKTTVVPKNASTTAKSDPSTTRKEVAHRQKPTNVIENKSDKHTTSKTKQSDKHKISPHKSPSGKRSDKNRKIDRSKTGSKSSGGSHHRSQTPEERRDEVKDGRLKEKRNYRSNRTESPEADVLEALKRKRAGSNMDEQSPRSRERSRSPRLNNRPAVRSRQVEGPGRSIRMRRNLVEERDRQMAVDEHQRPTVNTAMSEERSGMEGSVNEMPASGHGSQHDQPPPLKKSRQSDENPSKLSDDLL